MRPNKSLTGPRVECREGPPIPGCRTNGVLKLLPDACEIWSGHSENRVIVRSGNFVIEILGHENTGSLEYWVATTRNHPVGQSAGGGHACPLHIRANKLDDVIHWGARLENRRYAQLLQSVDILIGNDAPDQHKNVIHLVLLE
jgi:hypothetical protein